MNSSKNSEESETLPEKCATWEHEEAVEHDHGELLVLGSESWIARLAGRKFLLLTTLLLLLLPLVAPAAYHALKEHRVRQLVKNSIKAFASGDEDQGVAFLNQACLLSPEHPSVQRGVLLYQACHGDAHAAEILLGMMHSDPFNNDELLGVAESDSKCIHSEDRTEALRRLSGQLTPDQLVRQDLARASLMMESGDVSGAADYCFSHASSSQSKNAGRLRILGGSYLLLLHQEEASRRGVSLLLEEIRRKSPSSLAAWRILAQAALSQQYSRTMGFQLMHELVTLLPQLQGANFSDELQALDLAILADPRHADSIIDGAIVKNASDGKKEMLQLAWWLNSKGLYAKSIVLAGEDRPLKDSDWLLVVLCAHDALGHADALEELLSSTSAQGIAETMRYLILARSAQIKGDLKSAEEYLSDVDVYLHLEKTETLNNLAAMEERMGQRDHAVRVYREMADRSESKTQGLLGLVRLQSPEDSAESLIPIYEELKNAMPTSMEAKENLVYLKLLAGIDVQEDRRVADQLFAENPRSMSCLSIAALARLRGGDDQGALHLYEGKPVDWSGVADPWKAIRVAVLRKNGEVASADALAATVNTAALHPESQDLLWED